MKGRQYNTFALFPKNRKRKTKTMILKNSCHHIKGLLKRRPKVTSQEKKLFLEVSQKYIKEVDFYNTLLKKKFKSDYPTAWRSKGFPRTGTLDSKSKVYYSFHGIGCSISKGHPLKDDEWEKVIVDFDYHDGRKGEIRWDAIDIMRIKFFIESNELEKFYSLGTEEHMHSIAKQLVRDGVLQRKGKNYFFK